MDAGRTFEMPRQSKRRLADCVLVKAWPGVAFASDCHASATTQMMVPSLYVEAARTPSSRVCGRIGVAVAARY